MELVDKNATMQVLGCLIKNPMLYGQIEKDLVVDDFYSSFTRNIFVAISNLYKLGAESISVVDIDNYLQQFSSAYAEFKKNNGITYIQDCVDIAHLDSFDMYFLKVKKFSALKKLSKAGIDISDIYRTSFLNSKEEQECLDRFERMSIQDIFDWVSQKLSEIEFQYNIGKKVECDATEGIRDLKEEFKKNPEVGPALMGHYFNIICRGARKGKYYINSAGSGVGKSRQLIGNACKLAYPYQYNKELKEWEQNGSAEKTLIVTTELRKDEVQSIILANLSDVNEEHILYGSYVGDEEERVDKAIEIMEEFPNLFIEDIPDPNINLIKSVIKRHVNLNGIVNVFYDYIFSSPNLLGEFRDLRIREDVALLMLSTALKDLAVEYDLYIESATQLSGDYDNFEGIRNHTLIRGSKSIVDKADLGCITAAVNDNDRIKLSIACKKMNMPMPTQVKDIYKMRRGRYKNVRIWGIMDLGTGRWNDLFVTDGNYNVIPIDAPEVRVLYSDGMIDLTTKNVVEETKQSVAKPERKEQFDAWNFGI